MAIDVKITDNSKFFLDALAERKEQALIAIGLTAESYAKRDCPVDTGRLRNSITFATSTQHDSGSLPAEAEDFAAQGTPEEGVVYIGTNVKYAPSIELGMSHRKPKPFLRPAVTNHTAEYKAITKKALEG